MADASEVTAKSIDEESKEVTSPAEVSASQDPLLQVTAILTALLSNYTMLHFLTNLDPIGSSCPRNHIIVRGA